MPLSLSLINVLPNNAPSSGKKNLRKAVYFIRAFNLMYLTVKLIAVKALLLMFSLQATKEINYFQTHTSRFHRLQSWFDRPYSVPDTNMSYLGVNLDQQLPAPELGVGVSGFSVSSAM